ncbi:CoA transferase [Actinomadura sp. KC216]|uniref:CoA transferase n=1 Tax=Actinomadura sp. KC216 TaxID=2530370 RepID=UPI00104F9247|nr:CoA transferase [Actinomadura sp. KC216]TDB91931.1 CoA transferase [Actinomadura sp. KC216]
MAPPATVPAPRALEEPGLHITGPSTLAAGVAGRLGRVSGDRLALMGRRPLAAEIRWAVAAPGNEVTDEATAQAATGVMHVHGRRDGAPRGLAADYLSLAATALAAQGVLAAVLGRARGWAVEGVSTGVDLAGLLAVGQYLAASTAEEGEAVPPAPGGPPFVTADDVRFEVEALDPMVWAAFWRRLDVPERLAGSAWRAFQFRYATASCPLPEELHAAARAAGWASVRRAAEESGASVCALHRLADRLAEPRTRSPWTVAPRLAGAPRTAGAPRLAGAPRSMAVPRPAIAPCSAVPPRSAVGPLPGSAANARPLAGLTVLEAGRRIQAPLTAHLLALLGADVVRIEPPGGDPLRGMPPTCGGLSARWLALNRGKRAVEIDIKSRAGRDEVLALAAEAEVFVHNWAPGTAERLALDDADLRAVNPGLVYAYTGGWAGRLDGAPLATDFMVQARTGVGEAVRPADEAPAPSLMTLLDVLGGLLGAEAVLAGLLFRTAEGRGVRVDSSLLGAAEELTGPALRRVSEGRSGRAPEGFRRPMPTADGWVAVADDDAARAHVPPADQTTEDALRSFRRAGVRATAVTVALDELPADPRFASVLTRDDHGAVAVPTPWRFA